MIMIARHRLLFGAAAAITAAASVVASAPTDRHPEAPLHERGDR